jgi:ABC-2 type transport system ATP-binding protein
MAESSDTGDRVIIRTEHLSKRFEDIWGVRDLNLTVRRGELFAFLGPNGAGKTTTIKMLVGLLKPTEGRALVGGFDVQDRPVEAKSLVGYIPDQPYVYEKLSGRDFFHFVGDLFHIDGAAQEENRQKFFDLFGLTPVQDKLIENYSHGMRQKLVISAALMHDPAVVIVDEPMVGLDPQSARKVKDLFRSQAQRGSTVFLSTHTLSVAEDLAHRIGIINHGKLIFCGTIAQLREASTRGGEGDLEDLFLELTEEEAEHYEERK